MSKEPWQFTASEALQAFSKDGLTVEDYAKSLLKRIEERDDAVKAWAYLNPNQALEQARALDKIPKEQRGPLHGVAVGVKDVIYTKGEFFASVKRLIVRTDFLCYRHADSAQLADLQG